MLELNVSNCSSDTRHSVSIWCNCSSPNDGYQVILKSVGDYSGYIFANRTLCSKNIEISIKPGYYDLIVFQVSIINGNIQYNNLLFEKNIYVNEEVQNMPSTTHGSAGNKFGIFLAIFVFYNCLSQCKCIFTIINYRFSITTTLAS